MQIRIKLRKHFGIWGWWQGENLGDQWIKRTMTALFPKARFFQNDVTDFWGFDFMIIGGGGLFIFDVIPPWDYVRNLPAYGALGLGAEFPHPSTNAVPLKEQAKFFYVRDVYSLECMHLPDHERSYDITFAMPLPWEEKTPDMSKLLFVWRDGREWLDDAQFREYLHFADNRAEWEKVCFSRFKEVTNDDFQTHDDNIEQRMAGAGFVISGRYHGIVAAIQKGLPFIAIDICPKLRALCREADLERYCIKQDELSKADDLITDAMDHVGEIREKELAYRSRACETIDRHVANARYEILRVLRPDKVHADVSAIDTDPQLLKLRRRYLGA